MKASLSIACAIWHVTAKPDGLKDVSIEAQFHKKRLTAHFNGQGKHTVFEPNRILVETAASSGSDFPTTWAEFVNARFA